MRTGLLAAGVLAIGMASASAQESIADMVTNACQSEIDSYCSEVTPGEGRLLACFFAHEDKLSSGCVNALYDGMVQLERVVEAISYVATMCRADIDSTCAEIEPGEGRIAQCLLDNRDGLEPACQQAIDDVGLEAEG